MHWDDNVVNSQLSGYFMTNQLKREDSEKLIECSEVYWRRKETAKYLQKIFAIYKMCTKRENF